MVSPTQERVRELFNYDPQSGELIVRERPSAEYGNPASYARHLKRVGKAAGCTHKSGYRTIHVDGAYYPAHKVVWLHVIGEWVNYPAGEIDHINGIRSDNRIQNLRKCTKSMNQRNAAMRINNRSGVIGVNWVTSKQRWVARIWDGPHHRYLGQFADIEDARIARAKAERELGYHAGHGKSTPYLQAAKASS